MKKRNLIISGEFTMTEVANADTQAQSQNAAAPKAKSAAARIAALKAAGVDVSNYFPMGEEMVVKVVDGVPVQVTDDDPVFASIAGGGHIRNYTLYRRWVMSQMFHMLDRMERQSVSFNSLLQDKGYHYQWRMLEKELLDQYKMLKHKDNVCYEQRALWFNGSVASYMAFDYVQKLRSYIEKLLCKGTHTCKGKPYVRLSSENIFVSDLESKLYSPPPRTWPCNERCQRRTSLSSCCQVQQAHEASPRRHQAVRGVHQRLQRFRCLLHHAQHGPVPWSTLQAGSSQYVRSQVP